MGVEYDKHGHTAQSSRFCQHAQHASQERGCIIVRAVVYYIIFTLIRAIPNYSYPFEKEQLYKYNRIAIESRTTTSPRKMGKRPPIDPAAVAAKSRSPHFDEFTKLPFLFFFTIGMVPHQHPAELHQRVWLERFRFAFHAVAYFNCAWCVIGESIYLFLAYSSEFPPDIITTTSLVMCIGILLLSFVKIMTIWWQRDELNAITMHLYDMCPRTPQEQLLYQVDDYVAQAKRQMTIYAWVQMVMIWLFNLFPVMSSVVYWAMGGGWEVDFPYVIWYPFDAYPRGIFEVVFGTQMAAAYFATAGILGADMLLCGLVVQLCMHYDRLTHRLREYTPTGQTGSAAQKRADYAELKACVQLHDRLLWIGKTMDSIFGVCVLFNLVSSIIILCMLAFLVVMAGVSMASVKYLMTLVTSVVQIYLVCLLGERCIDGVSWMVRRYGYVMIYNVFHTPVRRAWTSPMDCGMVNGIAAIGRIVKAF